MQTDPIGERQRLAAHYSTLYEGELLALDADSEGLTEVAREALAAELKQRGLTSVREQERPAVRTTPLPVKPVGNDAVFNGGQIMGMEDVPLSSGSFSPVASGEEEAAQDAEYTWKTQLCEFEEIDQARLLQEALRRAGIESWVEGRRSMSGYPRLLVAADQLDAAREVAERPIPQEIVDELNQETPEFALPSCPACQAPDPILEDVEPTNQWLCESCGHRWSDPAEEGEPVEG